MSEENVRLVQKLYVAIDRGGIKAALGFFAPEVEVETGPSLVDAEGGGRLAEPGGIERLISLFGTLAESFQTLRVEPLGYWDRDSHVLAELRIGGLGASGAELWTQTYHLHTIRGGRSVRVQLLRSREDALAALASC